MNLVGGDGSGWTSQQAILLGCLAGAAAGLLVGVLARTTFRRASFRRSYANDRLPISLRAAVAVAPLYGSASLAAGLLVLLPRPVGAWVTIPVMAMITAAFVLSYRLPARMLPSWLREEVEAGITPRARPDFLDWVLFAIVVPVLVAGMVLIPVMILVYGVAS